MRRIAVQAHACLSEDERIDVSPHVLRHTFRRKLAEAKWRLIIEFEGNAPQKTVVIMSIEDYH